jgi:hypothetical protein
MDLTMSNYYFRGAYKIADEDERYHHGNVFD